MTAAFKKFNVIRMELAEMRMPRRMYGVILKAVSERNPLKEEH